MLQYIISPPERLRATVALPASKSISNRALVVGALAGGTLMPQNISDCDDTRVMARALRGVADCGDTPQVVDIMAAGTAMRFLTAYFSTVPGTRTVTGTERMRQRPIGVLVDALRALGADIAYTAGEGCPPLRINGGKLRGGCLTLAGSVSSQYVSALMMIGPTLEEGLRLRLTGGIVSRPYIDLTMRVMRAYGAGVEWTADDTLEVKAGGYRPTPYYIENDWSAASYWYEMVALSDDPGAEVRLPGLFADSGQGDQAVKDIFVPLGVKTAFTRDGIVIGKSGERARSLEMDFVRQPDLAQTVIAACCAMGIKFRFTGLQSLRIKETDRIAALKAELAKWGYEVADEGGGTMMWDGTRRAPADAPIDTYQDHRMAMAFAPACIVRGRVAINDPGVVSKSYPTYWDTLREAGFAIKEVERAL